MFRTCANPLIRCRRQEKLISQFFNLAEQNTAGSPILNYRASRNPRNQGKYMGFATISAVPITPDSIDKMPYITNGGLLRVEKHIVPAFPIRELVRGVRTGNEKLELVANCYRPLSNLNPQPGDLTILAAHGNGFHKELYEPFFEALVEEYEMKGSRIRSIWIADFHNQGESGVLNEGKLGGDVSWYDHSRDLLSLVMHLQNDFSRPIAAIGHSMGGTQLFNLSLLHPTLFSCVIGLDPVISPLPALPGTSPGNPATLSAKRRDIWSSYEEAVEYFKSRPFYREWDPKVLEIHMKYGLRKVPTALYPDVTKVGPDAVTLRTTKHQEVFTFWRSRIQDRTEPKEVFSRLKDMKAPVCYIQGEDSIVNWGNKNELMMVNTPQPCEIHFIPKCGHLVPLQKPKETAIIAATYLQRHTAIWNEETEQEKENWPATTTISPHYFEHRLRERTQADNHSSYDAGVGHQTPIESHV
ncbi:hypothetical protein TWF192_006846 [Orbilia oligospora]|uniref:AB hydrolase-1 domain-containing protein n=1 Tax=Orbilia oligospora TaxID=2813651 RepID=A0A6G1M6G2_ORBOL|nr:hypothetical protein TWF679_005648 [Orbilia oligospora]KAF3216696.1 hypothetical protein TWF191_008939 [Orbilia oligospora]KAF3246334.1 hypothetical protein TWF192_006846 [Orbilia oligospora]